MTDESTGKRLLPGHTGHGYTGAIQAAYPLPDGGMKTVEFDSPFEIGRDESCHIQLQDEVVSKRHAELYRATDGWWVRDLGSTNGTYLNGERVNHAQITRDSELRIAVDGPYVRLKLSETEVRIPEEAKEQERQSAFVKNQTDSQPQPAGIALVEDAQAMAQAMALEPQTSETDSLKPANESGKTAAKQEKASQPPGGPEASPGNEQPDVYEASPTGKKAASEVPPSSVTQIIQRYFTEKSPERAGQHTMLMRKAFKRVQRKQRKHYRVVIAVVSALLIVVLGVVFYQRHRLQKITGLGIDIFYQMKEMELQIGTLEEAIAASGDEAQRSIIHKKRQNLQAMQKRYEGFLEELGLAGESVDPGDRLIFRMARMFGECELNMPEDFLAEVKRYIHSWKTTPRLAHAVSRIKEHDYAPIIYRSMIEHHLPPQFLYLALQESDFKERAIGPKTRFGIAKGFWQFIPSTALQYGLQTGPLVELRLFDPKDDRFDFTKSTQAAAKYLKDIYASEAQASGLLVMAGYNWGHNRIKKRIRNMPPNPRERNFWKLLEKYKIPKQTYDYVFYILSAAVIGENPKLFGFDFDNPFQDLDGSAS